MGAYAGPDVVENGLVLALDAGNTKSYPGSGTTWTDLSGNGNNGTLVNGPTYSSSNGGSLVFDAEVSNSYIQTPTYDFTFTGDYAISVWFYLNDLGPDVYGATVLLSTGGSGSNDQIFIDGGGEGVPGRIYHGATTFIDTVTDDDIYLTRAIPVIEIEKWTNLVISRIGTSMKCYVNSVLKVDRVSVGTIGRNGPMRIGQRLDTAHPVLGNISLVSVYKNKGLNQSEVSQNFNAIRSRFGI